jgi:hypothetical protein
MSRTHPFDLGTEDTMFFQGFPHQRVMSSLLKDREKVSLLGCKMGFQFALEESDELRHQHIRIGLTAPLCTLRPYQSGMVFARQSDE